MSVPIKWEFSAIYKNGRYYNLDMTRKVTHAIYYVYTQTIDDLNGLSEAEQKYIKL